MKPRFFDFVLVASLLSNIALAYVIHRDRTPPPPPNGPKAGEMVGALTGFDDSGAKITIPSDSRGRPTVLYVFSQSCVWCKRSIPALQTLIPQNSAHFRFIAMDLTLPFAPSKTYLSANNLAFEESFHPDLETRTRVGAEGTPTSLVINAAGQVEKVFNGALIGPMLDSANAFFGTALHTDELVAKVPVTNRAAVAHSFSGCIQDGARFSLGALICWQGRPYLCESGKGWQPQAQGPGCGIGAYKAKAHPASAS